MDIARFCKVGRVLMAGLARCRRRDVGRGLALGGGAVVAGRAVGRYAGVVHRRASKCRRALVAGVTRRVRWNMLGIRDGPLGHRAVVAGRARGRYSGMVHPGAGKGHRALVAILARSAVRRNVIGIRCHSRRRRAVVAGRATGDVRGVHVSRAGERGRALMTSLARQRRGDVGCGLALGGGAVVATCAVGHVCWMSEFCASKGRCGFVASVTSCGGRHMSRWLGAGDGAVVATRACASRLPMVDTDVLEGADGMARLTTTRRGGMRHRLTNRHRAIVTVSTALRRALEASADVAGGAIGAGMRADQRKAGAAVVKAPVAPGSVCGCNEEQHGEQQRSPMENLVPASRQN
jgi:hypothetical protein